MWYDGLFMVPIDLGESTKNKKTLAKFKNMLVFQIVFFRLLEDALARYTIEGLPETCNLRMILQSLLFHSNVVFFDKKDSLMALPGAPSGDINIYGEPAHAYVYAMNGLLNEQVNLYMHGSDENIFLEKTLTPQLRSRTKGVMVWENKVRYPFINSVIYYAKAISDTLRTLDTVRANIKNPQIFVCEESVVSTVRKYLTEREENIDAIISSGVFDPTKVQVIPFDNKGAALNDVTALVEWYEAKFRELCGTRNNSQMDKKGENLISDEVSVNDDYTNDSVDKLVECMQEYLDDVNKIFGVSLKAKVREKRNDDTERDGNSSSDNSVSVE